MSMNLENIKILENDSIKSALKKIQSGRVKALIVVNKKNKLLGILNDANIRRCLLSGASVNSKIKNYYMRKKDIYFVYDGEYNFKLTKKKIIQNSFFIVPIVDSLTM